MVPIDVAETNILFEHTKIVKYNGTEKMLIETKS